MLFAERLSWSLFLLCLHASSTNLVAASFMEQSFYFDYAVEGQAVTVPVTTQCENIHIKWDRSSASGPNPSAPYYLQIYTSAFVFPFVVEAGSALSFDWQVPFGPGTLYQICMFDKNGYTGGCQATYTMIANTTVDTPSCANVTFPLGPLEVEAKVENGPLSQYGWISQCSDISITPKNGTPPYTMTVAPTLHPPYNLTFNSKETVKWTVDLSWAAPFFISVVDSEFNFWSYGPLHSGQGSEDSCLSSANNFKMSSTGKTVGIGVGGIVIGMLAGIAAAFVYYRRREKQRHGQFMALEPSTTMHSDFAPGVDPFASQRRPTLAGMPHHSSVDYQVEPFIMPGEDRHSQPPVSPLSTHPPDSHGSRTASGHVYVVHHDGGRAPITVYHEDGTEVVELPPQYHDDTVSPRRGHESTSSNTSDRDRTSIHEPGQPVPPFLDTSRRPGPNPRKQQRPGPQTPR